MPHIWIESSSNVAHEPEIVSLKHKLYRAALATGLFSAAGIRVRHVRVDDYTVGDNHPDNAFVHIVLRLGSERDESTNRRAAESMFGEIKSHLQALSDRAPLAVGFEVQVMHAELHFRFNNLDEHIAQRRDVV